MPQRKVCTKCALPSRWRHMGVCWTLTVYVKYFRVKADAEVLLMTMLNHMGNHPATSGPSSLSTVVSEDTLTKYALLELCIGHL